jgi:hypothetical protein
MLGKNNIKMELTYDEIIDYTKDIINTINTELLNCIKNISTHSEFIKGYDFTINIKRHIILEIPDLEKGAMVAILLHNESNFRLRHIDLLFVDNQMYTRNDYLLKTESVSNGIKVWYEYNEFKDILLNNRKQIKSFINDLKTFEVNLQWDEDEKNYIDVEYFTYDDTVELCNFIEIKDLMDNSYLFAKNINTNKVELFSEYDWDKDTQLYTLLDFRPIKKEVVVKKYNLDLI